MRDGVTIYTDIFRPNDDKPHPAIMAMSPYGKEIGSQWLDDTLNHAGIPMDATSGLQKFEGPALLIGVIMAMQSRWRNHRVGFLCNKGKYQSFFSRR